VKALNPWGVAIAGEEWNRLYHYGTQLLGYGYRVSSTKPNLFVRSYPSIVFFADLRGTRNVPLSRDSRPLFYWQLGANVDPARGARMVAIEATRLDPIPIRLPSIPDLEQPAHMELLLQVDRAPFQRHEPRTVPTAPPPATFRFTPRLFEAIDSRTGELIAAGDKAAGRPHLRCPRCRVPVVRQWDGALDRYAFEHPRTTCPMSPV
jgi:hypothetical protein